MPWLLAWSLVAFLATARAGDAVDAAALPGLDLDLIPAGTFVAGSPVSEKERSPNETPHEVTLTRPFWLATTHVTVAQFEAFVRETGHRTTAETQGWAYGTWSTADNAWTKLPGKSWRDPGFAQTSQHPVVCVTWHDAVAFCAWLSSKEGRAYRLPSEAEWEYACRAGSTTAYPWGDSPDDGQGWANCSDLDTAAAFPLFPAFPWHDGFHHTSPVASFRANAWGLHDMIGNTLQWCGDWYAADYPPGSVNDPRGPDKGGERILRGGAFIYGPRHCRSAFRGRNYPEFQNFYIGFRIARDVTPDEPAPSATALRQTTVGIRDGKFLINGRPTFPGRTWQGHSVEGLLPNSRMVQGIFDDLNPETRVLWNYPDTGSWDPDRNTAEFIAAMRAWRERGLLAFTLNLQGGSPTGYGNKGWINSAFAEDGSLRPDYFARLERILNRADELGMVVLLGFFYAGQSGHLRDETAVIRATDLALAWLFDRGYRNLLIEVCNESSPSFQHAILQPEGVVHLLQRIRETRRDGRSFPVCVSLWGYTLPTDAMVAASDVVLLHGNNRRGEETTPARIREMVAKTRALPSYRGAPIVFNEDDHYAFDQPDNNFIAATECGASWGYFDYRRKGEPVADGFQSVPVDWTISSPRKRAFFDLIDRIFQR